MFKKSKKYLNFDLLTQWTNMNDKVKKLGVIGISIIVFHTLIYYLWIFFTREQLVYKVIGGDLISITGAGISVVFAYISLNRRENANIRFFWKMIFCGNLSYFIAESIWNYYEIIIRVEVPFPGIFDIFYYLQIIFYFIAIVYKCYIRKQPYSTVRFLFDTTIVMSVITTLSKYYIIEPLFYNTKENLLYMIAVAGYPIGDLVLLFGALSLYFGYNHLLSKKVILAIIIGTITQALADSLYMYTYVYAPYASGTYFDPLWTFAAMVIGYSGSLNDKVENVDEDFVEYKWFETSRSSKLKILLPYLSIVFLIIMIISTDSENGSLFQGFIFTIVLVIIRQIAALAENQRLLRKLYEFNKELEEKIAERTLELTNSNKFKGEIISSMSHELRTPIHAVLSYVQLIEDGVEGPVNEEIYKDLQVIKRSTKRLLMIVENLMNLSRIESKKDVIKLEELNLKHIINNISEEFLYLAKEKGLQLITNVQGESAIVVCYRLNLEQIIINLLMNAIKFTQKGYVKITATVEKDFFKIAIEDTGIGITKEYHDYIFEEFTQIDHGLKRRYGGTGLGLFIVKEMVTSLGGEIILESEVGVGSKFEVKIPRIY